MTGVGTRARGAVAALAGAGVVVTHWIAYALAVPHDGHRSEVLEGTGHGYAAYVSPLVLAALVAALVRHAAAVRAGTRVPRAGVVAARLAVLQGGCFALVELAERHVSGAGVSEAPLAIGIGLAVQLAVALAGALLLAALTKVVRALARARRRPRARASAMVPPTRAVVVRSLVACGGATLRGPPATA